MDPTDVLVAPGALCNVLGGAWSAIADGFWIRWLHGSLRLVLHRGIDPLSAPQWRRRVDALWRRDRLVLRGLSHVVDRCGLRPDALPAGDDCQSGHAARAICDDDVDRLPASLRQMGRKGNLEASRSKVQTLLFFADHSLFRAGYPALFALYGRGVPRRFH